ncbi:MAG: acetyl-CoA carboxylase biotin carboxyl carrier protein subunit [Henriciella sp.]|nr:acetyl-CoA carboxylase biotin carboxyl carrier protein subunit [Henriciella sp.]
MATIEIELETGGTVWKTLVKPGDQVSEGQELFILEVMKMEVPYTAPASGTLSELLIAETDVVEEGQKAAILETG